MIVAILLAACPASLPDLSSQFWEWRARTQPYTADDIPRLERPKGFLPSWSAASVTQMRKDAAQFRECLARLRDGSADARLLGSAIARVRWELDLNRRWQRDPNFYSEQALTPVVELIVRPQVDAAEVAAHLRNVPALLDQGRANLSEPVAVFAQLAVASLEGIRDKLRTLPVKDEKAAEALEGYRAWLQTKLPSMKGRASVGRAAYETFLHDVALMPYTPEQLLSMARQEWERCVAAEALELRRNQDAPQLPLFANIDAQMQAYARDENQIRKFLEARGVLTVPESIGHYTVRPITPAVDALGDFGEQDDFLSPEGIRWLYPPSEKLGYFGRANARDPRPNITHEGVPGHFFQLALSRNHPDAVRRHYYDSGANEGLGFYAEEMMMQAGLYDQSPRTREIVWAMARLRAARVQVDVKLALGEMTLDAAANYLVQRAPMDPRTAHAEAASFSVNPGQAMTYQIGKLQIEQLLAEARFSQGAAFDLRRFHDALWLNGNVPIALLREELVRPAAPR